MSFAFVFEHSGQRWIAMPTAVRQMPCHRNALVRVIYACGEDNGPPGVWTHACKLDWTECHDPDMTIMGWMSSDIQTLLKMGNRLEDCMKFHFRYWTTKTRPEEAAEWEEDMLAHLGRTYDLGSKIVEVVRRVVAAPLRISTSDLTALRAYSKEWPELHRKWLKPKAPDAPQAP